MTQLKQSFAELVSLTQLFLMSECTLKQSKIVDPTLAVYFQKKAPFRPPTEPISPKNSSQPSERAPIYTEAPQKFTPFTPPLKSQQTPPQPPPPTPVPIKPEPSPPETQPPVIQRTDKETTLSLEPLKAYGETQSLDEMWKICKNTFPHLILSESIPKDTLAKKLKNSWLNKETLAPVIILSFNHQEKEALFLKNIAQAITLHLSPACVLSALQLEKENQWEKILNSSHTRLIIATDYSLYVQPHLMRFYKEVPQQSKHFLNQIPLMLLSDISLYLKEPQLKAVLWRAICNEFMALHPPSNP